MVRDVGPPPTPAAPAPPQHGPRVRLLVVVLIVQLVFAGLLIWAAAGGFSFVRSWLGDNGSHSAAHPARSR